LSRTDSEGQPLTFPTRTLAAGVTGTAGTPVTGAVSGVDRTNNPWYLLGAATQYHTVQDQFKAKLAYDFSPTMRATYTFGLWRNDSEGRPHLPARRRRTAGLQRRHQHQWPQLLAGKTDFNLSNEDLQHVMHGLTVKTNTRAYSTGSRSQPV
jgi:iron complex outermembrane receptor protein